MKRRNDGLLQKSIQINGKRKVFYGKTIAEINKKIIAYQETEKQGLLFHTVAEEWEREHFQGLAVKTISGYSPALQRAIAHFGNEHIRSITPKAMQEFVNRFASMGMAKKTVSTQRLVLNMIFDYAVLNGYVESNIMTVVHIPKGLKQTVRDCPTDDELRKVCESIDVPFGFFAYFILYTGLRRGEALALTIDDICYPYIVVNKSVSYETNAPTVKCPKTKAGERLVPLPKHLYTEIQNRCKGKYLFPNTEGNMIGESGYQRRWEEYQRITGLNITAHQLRHAYATIILRDFDDFDVQHFIGHKDISTTRNIYTHMRNERIEQASEKMQKIF